MCNISIPNTQCFLATKYRNKINEDEFGSVIYIYVASSEGKRIS